MNWSLDRAGSTTCNRTGGNAGGRGSIGRLAAAHAGSGRRAHRAVNGPLGCACAKAARRSVTTDALAKGGLREGRGLTEPAVLDSTVSVGQDGRRAGADDTGRGEDGRLAAIGWDLSGGRRGACSRTTDTYAPLELKDTVSICTSVKRRGTY